VAQIHFDIVTSNHTYYALKLLRYLYMPYRDIGEDVLIHLNDASDLIKAPARRRALPWVTTGSGPFAKSNRVVGFQFRNRASRALPEPNSVVAFCY
jgi:hypothetical protein